MHDYISGKKNISTSFLNVHIVM